MPSLILYLLPFILFSAQLSENPHEMLTRSCPSPVQTLKSLPLSLIQSTQSPPGPSWSDLRISSLMLSPSTTPLLIPVYLMLLELTRCTPISASCTSFPFCMEWSFSDFKQRGLASSPSIGIWPILSTQWVSLSIYLNWQAPYSPYLPSWLIFILVLSISLHILFCTYLSCWWLVFPH